MPQKIFIFWIWLPITILLVFINGYLLISLEQKKSLAFSTTMTPNQMTLSSNGTEQVLGALVDAGDARAILLEKFLTTYGSPLAQFSGYIVEQADINSIDYRLVPAISMCESGGGVRIPSRDSHNAWGISVEDGQLSGAKFHNWLFAVEWVSKYIKEKYHDYGLLTPVQMGAKWAPSSVQKGNSWANCVEFFIEKII